MACFFPGILAYTDGDYWRPGIGDPTLMGWVTVLAYFVAAGLAFRVVFKGLVLRADPAPILFWGILGLVLVFLGINKQLDLQTWFTLAVRRMAIHQGWYEYRRVFQSLFVIFIALGGAAGFAAVWMLARNHRQELKLPLMGLFVLGCFIMIRAASFHQIDQLLKFSLAGFRLNWMFELTGIGLIIAAALRPRLSGRSRSPGGRRIAPA